MTWRSNYVPGSFRGASFQVESHEHALGRRAQLHEYPMRDLPYAEDLGRKGRVFKLELYVIGPDYMDGRDALRAALEAEGPGTLAHPYLGTHQVQVMGEATLRESLREGGMARFSVTFVEAGQLEAPDTAVDTASVVASRADDAKGSILDDAVDKISVSGPEFVRIQLIDDITAAVDDITSAAMRVSTTGIGVWIRQAKELYSALSTLISTPENLLSALLDLVLGLSEYVDDSTALTAGVAYAEGVAATASTTDTLWTTAERSTVRTNAQAISDLVVYAMLIGAAKAASDMDFDSADDALAARESLARALDTAALDATDAVYADLVDLRAGVITDLGTRAAQLPVLSTYTPATTLPALVLAHRIYGDATREGEIVARNKVRHPGAIPGGTALEVLTNA